MVQKQFMILALWATLGLTGCSSNFWNSPNTLEEHKFSRFGKHKKLEDAKKNDFYETAHEQGIEGIFSFGSEDGLVGSIGGNKKKSQEELRSEKLFAAALDVLLELPVKVASPESGFIATDWKTNPKDPNLRYRLQIRVSGQEPYGEIKVVVLKQGLRKGKWVDLTPDSAMASNIRKAIRRRSEMVKK